MSSFWGEPHINDEISACLENRGPLCDLLENILQHEKDSKSNILVIRDLREVFSKRSDFINGSIWLDFIVSSYSAFESWISAIYNSLNCEHSAIKSKKEKLMKLIADYNKNSEENKPPIWEKIMTRCSSYISGKEKIDCILSMSLKNSEFYRDHMKVIDFYRRMRNTIHNLGTNQQEYDELSIENKKVVLRAKDSSYCDNWTSNVDMARKLVEIYDEIINKLKIEDSVILVTR